MSTIYPPLTDDQRYQASDLMTEHGLNKCYDCCLVPSCPTCGPCQEHDEQTEAQEVFAWAVANGLDNDRVNTTATRARKDCRQ